MTRRGRPLRFLALVAMAWIATRLTMVLSGPVAPQAGAADHPGSQAASNPMRAARSAAMAVRRLRAPLADRGGAEPIRAPAPRGAGPGQVRMMRTAAANAPPVGAPPAESGPGDGTSASWRLLLAHPSVSEGRIFPMPSAPRFALPPPPVPLWRAGMRVSSWLVVRGRGASVGAPGAAQLGGGQAGLRVVVPLVPSAGFSGFARLSAPLAGTGREAAMGLEWRPGRLPVRIVAGRRFSLDHAAGGLELGVLGGVDSVRLPAGFSLEGYGQAGAIQRHRIEPYADGALRVLRPIARLGPVGIALGIGGWGGAQRDAARFDLGPSAAFSLPVAGRSVRLSLDWRQRLAGAARPGSGPVLTLGSDF